MQIKMLNSETINQIAAGEVVVRPASVVKELVENAIDAKATEIKVSIEEGGRKSISISDNGIGIPFNEIPLAFKRHATSKITSIDDLTDVRSLGFRGEALSSIAAVSKVKIKTKYVSEEVASETILTEGRIVSSRPCGRNQGTTIIISDLFYNIPARYKHMGKAQTEALHIADMMQKLALSHPEIAFTYESNHKTQFRTLGDGDLQGVIENIFGRAFMQTLIPLDYENAPMTLSGYIGGLKAMKHSKDYQIFFINGRYVKNAALARAFEEAYEGYVMQHCHPVGIMMITLPQKMLDVNIHPAKTEIGILNQSLFALLFKQGIRETLRQTDLSVKLSFDAEEPDDVPIPEGQPVKNDEVTQLMIAEDDHFEPLNKTVLPERGSIRKTVEEYHSDDDHKIDYSPKTIPLSQQIADETVTYRSAEKEKTISFQNTKIIGQLFNTYIVLEQGDEAFLIDQHAAHEAFMYDELKSRFAHKEGFPSQMLMPPQRITLEPQIINQFDLIRSKCAFYGFDCEIADSETLLIRSVPVILGKPLAAEDVRDTIDTLLYQDEAVDQSAEIKKIITMACKSAVKGNQVLSITEIKALLTKLERIDNPFTCPHGRPIIFRIKKYDLEKMFKRVL